MAKDNERVALYMFLVVFFGFWLDELTGDECENMSSDDLKEFELSVRDRIDSDLLAWTTARDCRRLLEATRPFLNSNDPFQAAVSNMLYGVLKPTVDDFSRWVGSSKTKIADRFSGSDKFPLIYWGIALNSAAAVRLKAEEISHQLVESLAGPKSANWIAFSRMLMKKINGHLNAN